MKINSVTSSTSNIASASLLFPLLILICSSGTLAFRNVTLGSIEIFTTHEWFKLKPTVYFRCKGESKTYLPDVKEKNHSYTFKGQESWQPLTALPDQKCKRCGLYEEDKLSSDDTFDEWELCPDDFNPSDGKYSHYKEKEFKATFLCPLCNPDGSGSSSDASGNVHSAYEIKRSKKALIIILTVSICLALFAGAIFLYKFWKEQKRKEQAARFLKLFEEEDDREFALELHDEL